MHVRWAMTLMAAAICCAGVAHAADPSGGELIEKYLKASGGKEKLAAVKSRVDTGTFMLVDMGMEASYTNTIAPPNSLMALDFGGQVVKNGVTDGTAWSVNPFQGNSKTETDNEPQIFPSLGLSDAIPVAKNLGEEEVEGAACYKVETPSPEGGTLTFWFDKETGLLAKSVDSNGSTTILSDYKEVDGISMAHKIAQSGGELNFEITITKVEIDADVDDSTFEIPAEVE